MHTFTYGMIRKIFNLATYGALGMEVIGEENIPEKGHSSSSAIMPAILIRPCWGRPCAVT